MPRISTYANLASWAGTERIILETAAGVDHSALITTLIYKASSDGRYKATVPLDLTANLTFDANRSIGFGGNTSAAAANPLIYSDNNYLAINSKAAHPLYLNFDNANASSTINCFNGKLILTQPGVLTLAGTMVLNMTTTASAANVHHASDGTALLRSTSSLRYKRDVETADPALVARALDIRVIWYRSKATADSPDQSFWGVAAEEVAEIDPRLVQYGYLESDYETVEVAPARPAKVNKAGEEIAPARPAEIRRRLKRGAKPVPDGAQYERLNLLRTEALKNRIEALEARLEDAGL